MTFSREELQKIDAIKLYMVAQVEKKGDFLPEPITDKMALEYALGVTEIFIQQQYQQPKKTNKQKLQTFLAKK